MESSPLRAQLAENLRTLGCEVFCVQDLDQAANQVRAGLPRHVILLHLGRRQLSTSVLYAEMAKRLPGWSVAALDAFELREEPESSPPTRSLLN